MEDKLYILSTEILSLYKPALREKKELSCFKLDYMIRLFHSIRNKPFESYVIQRIWHRLDDERVFFVTQQYFLRSNSSYALVDLYLPQLNLVIEVDEGYHGKLEQQKRDTIRSREIRSITDAEIIRITLCKEVDGERTCRPLWDVNSQIDKLVVEIKCRINEMGCAFRPWMGVDMFSPVYYKFKGYFSVYENDYVRTINEAADIFGTKVKNRGFLRPGGFDVPGKTDEMVWCPNVNSRDWSNEISPDGQTIREYNKKGDPKRADHVKHCIQQNKKRITFMKMKDALGYNYCKFVGVFVIDPEQSLKENKCVWRRVADIYILDTGNNPMPKHPCWDKRIIY